MLLKVLGSYMVHVSSAGSMRSVLRGLVCARGDHHSLEYPGIRFPCTVPLPDYCTPLPGSLVAFNARRMYPNGSTERIIHPEGWTRWDYA